MATEQCDQPKSRNRAALKWKINRRDSVIAVVIPLMTNNVEYRYCARSIKGLLAIVICAGASVGFFVASLYFWIWTLFLTFTIYCTVVAVIAYFRCDEWGCKVDDKQITWWETALPASRNSMSLGKITDAELEITEDGPAILYLTGNDSKTTRIDSRFIGDGRKIYKAIRERLERSHT